MAGDENLIREYEEIHKTRNWGCTSVKNLRHLLPQIRTLRPKSIIDYGCGTSPLLELINVESIEHRGRYDPAIPEYAEEPPGKYDLLVSIDVLEHIAEEDLEEVLQHMDSLCKDAIIVVDTKPAQLLLADGRNAHICLHDHRWWQSRLEKQFGPLTAFRVKRSSRAAFRTWPLSPLQKVKWAYWRFASSISYLGRRLKGIKY